MRGNQILRRRYSMALDCRLVLSERIVGLASRRARDLIERKKLSSAAHAFASHLRKRILTNLERKVINRAY